MASTPKQPQHSASLTQGELFGVEARTEHLGEVVHTEVTSTDAATPSPQPPQLETVYHVDTRERAALLHAALGHMANAAMHKGADKALHTEARTKFEQRYGPAELESRAAHATFARTSQRVHAEEKFLQAYNLGRAQPVTPDDVDFKHDLTEFNYTFGVGGLPQDAGARRNMRDAYRQRLETVMKIPGPALPLAKIPVELVAEEPVQIQVPKTERLVQKQHVSPDEQAELDAMEKSNYIGFYPTTREERTMLRSIFKHGLENYAARIVGRQKREHGEDKAQETAASIIHEIADFWQNVDVSVAQLDGLRDGHQAVAFDASSLIPENPGLVRLIRYLDFKHVVQEVIEPPFDLLQTKNNRSLEARTGGANKRIEDQYTTRSATTIVADHVTNRVKSLRPNEIAQLAEDAALEQANRKLFWAKVLTKLAETYPDEVEAARLRVTHLTADISGTI